MPPLHGSMLYLVSFGYADRFHVRQAILSRASNADLWLCNDVGLMDDARLLRLFETRKETKW